MAPPARKRFERAVARTPSKPGTWRPLQTLTGPNAVVVCMCGKPATLEDHIILEDGSVNPSLVCPAEGCDFHEWVTLVDWKL